MTIPVRSRSAVDEIDQFNNVIEPPIQKPNLMTDLVVVDAPEDGQPATDLPSQISEQQSLDTALLEKTTSSGTNNLPLTKRAQDQHVMFRHLDIDNDEFKIAVNVPRLGMDRMLDSVMLHGKLNDLLERGLIPHDAANAAFRQAQQNRVVR